MQKLSAREIAQAVDGKIIGSDDALCEAVSINSKKIKENDLFIAIKGQNFDAHDFIDEAFCAGASVVISQRNVKIQNGVALILVNDTKQALGRLAKWYKKKFNIKTVGVTGSVGKTSTKEFIYAVLSQKYNCFRTQGNFNNDIGLPLSILE
jgi:UDP-N-acetylmuramoyl-tripeptide--D-alanyl-D-alanine ligase